MRLASSIAHKNDLKLYHKGTIDWNNYFNCHVTVDMIVYHQTLSNIQIDWNLLFTYLLRRSDFLFFFFLPVLYTVLFRVIIVFTKLICFLMKWRYLKYACDQSGDATHFYSHESEEEATAYVRFLSLKW